MSNNTELQQENGKDPVLELIDIRQSHPNQVFLGHLNIKSPEQVWWTQTTNDRLKAGILVLTETKIDFTNSDAQFKMQNYRLYRQDQVEGGGGIRTYISTRLPYKRLKNPKPCKTIESLTVEVNLDNTRAIILGMYRPQGVKVLTTIGLDQELNEITSWAISKSQTIIVIGIWTYNRQASAKWEWGKTAEVFELTCLINQATRVTTTTSTLLDVTLTRYIQVGWSCWTGA